MFTKGPLLVVALVAGCLAASAVVVALLVDARNTAIQRAERSSAVLARAIEEHTARTVQSARLTVAGIADARALARPPKNDPHFQGLLRHRLTDLPYVRALFIIGPDGRLIHDTDYPRTPDSSLADRPYFRAHREDPQLETAVSGPYLSRSGAGAGWFVSVTARLGGAQEFHGVVVAAVQAAYFEEIYRSFSLSEGDVLALFHRDGTLVARHPAGEQEVGKAFNQLALFSTWLPRAAQGSHRIDGHMVRGRRIVSYRSVEGLPFVVHVSRSERAVLAEWRRSAVGAAVAMGALTLLLGGVLVQQLRRRMRRERARVRRAQAEKLEALGQLTGGIAHDFGNLLQVISMNLHLIAERPDERAAVTHALTVAQRAAQRGGELVTRLLAFARRQPLEVKPADLNSLVTQARPLLAHAAGTGVELELQLAPGLAPVLTDESQFEVALLNLVVNARDAMSGQGRIVLRTYAAPTGEACLAVEDHGPGMSEHIRRRALEPFFTTKGEGGTGLGLPQVYGFLRQTGGDLQIDSSPGRGTRVHLRFPPASAMAGAVAAVSR